MDPTIEPITGSQAIARGALRAGCDYLATCPTAATESISIEFQRALRPPDLEARGPASNETRGQVVKSADAAEAVRRCLEAAAAGAKAMVATAGSDLCPCGEIVGRAQWGETPLVVVHCQYLVAAGDGAAVTGEGDVVRSRHLTPGGLPVPVLAATDVASAYRLTYRAFDIAGRLRTPVVLLTSKDIATSAQAVDLMAEGPPPAVRAASFSPAAGDVGFSPGACGTGVSPASSPQARQDQEGAETAGWAEAAVTPDAAQLEARLTRLRNKITNQRNLLEVVESDPDPDAETLLVSYGLADQAACRAVATVRAAGARVSHLTIHSLWPIPEQAIRRAMTPFVRRVLLPELNMGLYADELRRIIKAVKIESILRYDGRRIDPETIARRITDWPCG